MCLFRLFPVHLSSRVLDKCIRDSPPRIPATAVSQRGAIFVSTFSCKGRKETTSENPVQRQNEGKTISFEHGRSIVKIHIYTIRCSSPPPARPSANSWTLPYRSLRYQCWINFYVDYRDSFAEGIPFLNMIVLFVPSILFAICVMSKYHNRS